MTAQLNIICLMGPTAAGKTQLAIDLAAELPIEVISVDSALIYREMNIGTAKPDATLLNKVPHHLIDIKDPTESYSAADFCHDAKQLIAAIHARGNIPLLVGGTMLYYRSLWQGLSILPAANKIIRQQIDARAAEIGWPALHDELKKVDPVSAARIHPNDPQRLQRALEVFYLTGRPLSDFFADAKPQPAYRTLKVAIAPNERSILHERIAMRFDDMLAHGFVNEVIALRNRGDLHLDLPSMRAVGYRQIWQYLDGLYDYQTMREKGIIATRQLAKRQLTWLRSFDDIIWLTTEAIDNQQQMLFQVKQFLHTTG
ncbi:MAG: tRNA (adenosine(37)-N6)-dimethylallyltransferase MiaA [Gammaproteobacteria bacterium]